MRHILAALVLGLLGHSGIAQTTGFPGVNDLTINGTTSGSTSCGFVLATGLPMTFTVSTAPNVAVVVFIDTCPCQAGFFPLAPVTCTSGVTYTQSIDMFLGSPNCVLVNFGGVTNSAGVFSATIGPCPTPFRFSTQAAVLNPACPPFMVTQAYQVSC